MSSRDNTALEGLLVVGGLAALYYFRDKLFPVTTPSESLVYKIQGLEGYFGVGTINPLDGHIVIGYGHDGDLTIHDNPADNKVQVGTPISSSDALAQLVMDIDEAGSNVLSYVTVPMTQNQLDGLTDFEFNTGAGEDDVYTYVNNGDWQGAANWMKSHYLTSNGVQQPGLVTRRAWDAQMLLS